MSAIPSSRPPRRRQASLAVRDLRGGVMLAMDTVRAAIGGAERLHQRVADVAPPVRGVHVGRPASGWWPVLYRSLRGTTDFVGGSVDLALASVQASLQDPVRERTPGQPLRTREAAIAALNALLGDHLHRTSNPLAIGTRIRQAGVLPQPRVVLLVHDLGLDGLQWRQGTHDHGEALAAALGATPLYATYNSGRHVWSVARELATELDSLLAKWPVPLEGLALVGHGLGGLVVRSAIHQAGRSGLGWPAHLKHVVFLGTPFLGAASERVLEPLVLGSLRAQSLLLPVARVGGVRSEGLRDFLEGRWLDPELPAGQAAALADPMPAGVRTFAVAGAVGDGSTDGVVPVASALAQGAAAVPMALEPADVLTASGVDHLALLRSDSVLQAMRRWLSE
jgi:hypothetical protein